MSGTIDTVKKLVLSGDLVQARLVGESLCKKQENAELLFMLAVITARLSDTDSAIDYAKRSIKMNGSVADTHFFLATVLREQEKIDSAIVHVKRGLELNPESAEGYNKLGAFLRIKNKDKEAEKAFRSAIKIDENYALANNNLGYLLHEKYDLTGAEECFLKTLELMPDFAEAHNELGSVLLEQGKLEESLESLNNAIRFKADYAEAYTNMGAVLDMSGKHNEAISSFRQAVTIEPGNIDRRKALATSLLESGGAELHEAILEFRVILDIEPDHVMGLIGLAHANLYLGKEDECIENARQILDHHPDNDTAMAGAASIYDRLRRFEDAYDCLRPLVEKGIDSVSVALLFASICRHVSQCDKAIEQIENILNTSVLVSNDKRQLYFAVAKLHDRQKNYEQAFKFYEKANDLKFCIYDPDDLPKKISALLEVYTSDFLKVAPHSDVISDKMIFIVGMPRSGTSLMEQVLDSHSRVFGAGELIYLGQTLKNLQENWEGDNGYPYFMRGIEPATLNKMAKRYLDRLPDHDERYRHVTDKLPNNFLHLGVIEMLFPNARVIHCKRDPLDTCLSCYFQDFSGYLSYSYNLEHLGSYYRQYLRLMEHWKRVLNIPVLDMQYERMVTNTEECVKTVLEFCGLPWEEGCLNFHNSSRVVNTASYDQVRRPIYKGSMGRWRNYSNNIAPLKKALHIN